VRWASWQGSLNSVVKMKYLESYRGWQIYVIPEAYLMQPANQLIDRYIAIEPETHSCIDDVTLGSLKTTIDEMFK
jgi:hypothetical protein